MSSLPARLLLRELELRGVHGSGALAAAGIPSDSLEGEHARMSWNACGRFVNELCKLVPDEDFGLCAGMGVQLSDIGLAGLYLRNQDDTPAAAKFYREHRDLVDMVGSTDVHDVPDGVLVAISPPAQVKAPPLLVDCMLAGSLYLAKEIIGTFEPLAVHLRRRPPVRDEVYRRAFGDNVSFDQDADAFLIPRGATATRLPNRDATALAVLEPYIAAQLQRLRTIGSDPAMRAMHGIKEELAAGTLSMSSLAQRLRQSPRSLRRALHNSGTGYSELVEQVREELARGYALQTPRLRGAEIARLLGYRDQRAFYRAFRRWTGMPLSEFRASLCAFGRRRS